MIKCKRGAKELTGSDSDDSGQEYTSYLILTLGVKPKDDTDQATNTANREAEDNTDQATNTVNREAKDRAEVTENPTRRKNCRVVRTTLL